MVVWSSIRTFLLLCVLGCVWMAGFLTVSSWFSPTPPPVESEATKNVRRHFIGLAAGQRRQLDVDKYYSGRHIPGMIDVIVEFTEKAPLPPKTIAVDGFVPKHVDIALGENGINTVLGVFTRRPPYEWPRTLDVTLGPSYTERADLVDAYSSDEVAFYRVNNGLKLDMKSPNGRFGWTLSNDKFLMTSPQCLFRQDLYKDGEWIKSLLAIAN